MEGSGNTATFIVAEADDGQTRSGLWTCPVGKFRFFFPYEEHVFVIEGKVTVTDKYDGNTLHELGPGDMAFFPKGCNTIWEVTEPLKKYFVMRD